MALRRGFKAEANTIARQVRSELGISFAAPLDPWTLAEDLAIPMITLSSMSDLAPNASQHFSSVNSSEFSAVTVFRDTKRVIVYNDSHSKGRQASDITHELSHGLLLHTPKPALATNGCRDWDEDLEDEADWLGGVLLISEEAALNIARLRMTIEEAALFYGVSEKMVRWRLSMTAAHKRVGRARQSYKSRASGNH